jgi:hypothetical protein
MEEAVGVPAPGAAPPADGRAVARGPLAATPSDLAAAAIVGLTFVWCVVRSWRYASYVMFSDFATYDDEGYILVSVREFLLGRPLYDEVFSQYGPSYFAYKHVLSLFHGLPTQDLTRFTTLLVHMCSTGLLALTALWLTRSGIAATATFCLTTVALQVLANEPGHPQELLVLLTSLSVAVAAGPLRLPVRTAALASIAAVACLAKINVGVFVGLALAAAAIPGAASLRQGFAVALALLPAALMWRHVSDWAGPYALASGAAVLTAVMLAPDAGARIVSFKRALHLAAAVVLPIAMLGAYVLARGTSLSALVDGVVIRPASLADVFVVPFRAVPRGVAISLAAAGLALFIARRDSGVQPYLGVLKVGVGLYVGFWLRLEPAELVSVSGLVVCALLCDCRAGEPFARGFLGVSAALHTLTAFPVAGSQLAWSSFLLILAAVVCVWDGLRTARITAVESAAFHRIAGTALLCLSLAVFHANFVPVGSVEALYRSRVPLAHQGSTSTRVSPAAAATYNWLVANLTQRCSAFVSLPGFNSLHIWSGIRPVTGFNATAWMHLLNDREQATVVERMRETPRPCAVYHAAGVAAWTSDPFGDRPLARYVSNLTPVAARGGYELRVPASQIPTWSFEYLLAGRRAFDGDDAHHVPADALMAPAEASLRLWFRARGGGVILGAQSAPDPQTPQSYCPVIYLGQDGRLRAGLWNGAVASIVSSSRFDDDGWHHVALVKRKERQLLYIDGAFAGEAPAAQPVTWANTLQFGTGYTNRWPEGNGEWFPFTGDLQDAIVVPRAWDPGTVHSDYAQPAEGNAPQR